MIIEIRNALCEDIAQLQEIFDLRENLAKLERYSDRKLLEEIRSPTSMFLVAVGEGRLKGFIWVSCISAANRSGKIEEFACNPTGKGIGKVLLETAILRLRDSNVSQVWLAVACDNKRAIGFYEDFGFRMYERRPAVWKRRTGDVADACFFKYALGSGPITNR